MTSEYKYPHFDSRKCTWKCRLQNVSHAVQVSDRQTPESLWTLCTSRVCVNVVGEVWSTCRVYVICGTREIVLSLDCQVVKPNHPKTHSWSQLVIEKQSTKIVYDHCHGFLVVIKTMFRWNWKIMLMICINQNKCNWIISGNVNFIYKVEDWLKKYLH